MLQLLHWPTLKSIARGAFTTPLRHESTLQTTEACAAPGGVYTRECADHGGVYATERWCTGRCLHLHLHLDVSTIKRLVLLLQVSISQGPKLHLDVSTLQRHVLHRDREVSTPQGPELHLGYVYTTGARSAPGHI
jgi:hypothetical protein